MPQIEKSGITFHEFPIKRIPLVIVQPAAVPNSSMEMRFKDVRSLVAVPVCSLKGIDPLGDLLQGESFFWFVVLEHQKGLHETS